MRSSGAEPSRDARAFVRRAARRVGGFTASVLITGLTGILTIPLIVTAAGATTWAAIAVGQTIGIIATVFVALGWPQLGPTEIARADSGEQATYYTQSVIVRVAAYALATPLIVFVAATLSPGAVSISIICALGSSALSLSGAWFFIGAARPTALLLCETLPRAILAWAGTVATAVTHEGVWAAWGFAVGPVFAGLISAIAILRWTGHPEPITFSALHARVRAQLSGIGIGFFSTIYQTAPLLIVSSTLPGATASYALGDRIRQQAMTAVAPLAQSVQSWVPRAQGAELRRRVRVVRNIALGLGTLCAIAFVATAPLLTRLLGAGKVTVDFSLIIAFGVTFGLNIITLLIGNACLLPLDKGASVARSALIGTILISLALPVFMILPTSLTVAAATSVAQTGVLLTQLLSLRRALRASTPSGGKE